MNGDSRLTLRWPAVGAAALALLAVGAGIMYVVLQSSMRSHASADHPLTPVASPAANSASVPMTAGAATQGPLPDVAVTLSRDAVERARIVVAPVTSGSGASAVRLPGVVEPNAYQQVSVTPLVTGRITRVLVELGQSVRRGQTMAEIFSPELAETATRYISARAELEAHDRELQRTEKLVEIGAASRQELERIHAEHTARQSGVESVRSRLELLGMSASSIAALAPGREAGAIASVPAPIAGVVTERTANVGLNVDPAAKLFTVVDLSTVWLVADLYERDFSRVRVGTPATITTTAYPDLVLRGRVSYIDPQVSSQTRTAKLRIEVPNTGNQLRLGMYADVMTENSWQASVTLIPRSAVQYVGDRTVVYLANSNEPGRFIEREVRLGQVSGDQVDVLSGAHTGDTVVTEGSFSVRAEQERLGLRLPMPTLAARGSGSRPAGAAATQAESNLQTAKVVVGERGYEPAKVSLHAGVPARITFVRTTEKTCGTEVVFPTLRIRRALPLNEPVVVEFTPAKAGDVVFVCGMNMLRGVVVVE